MRDDAIYLRGPKRRRFQSACYRHRRSLAGWVRRRYVKRIGCDRAAGQLGDDFCSALLSVLQRLDDHRGGSFPVDEAVAVTVEGAASTLGLIVARR